jgi:exodeoxyribonuclease-3
LLLATWNVNGYRARAERISEWLAERKPDVVCMQEMKIKTEELDRAPFTAAGYHVAFVGQASWNGVAILSKAELTPVLTELPGAAADAGARFLSARTKVGDTELEVASVYVPNGKTVSNPEFKGKLAWLEQLALYVEGRKDRQAPFVLAGDLNVCPTDLDSWMGERGKGTIFHTDEERALIRRLTSAGLVDLYRTKYPLEAGFSFWDYRAGAFHRKLGMRIDLLLATAPLARRVTEVRVDRDFRKKSKTSGALPSDHAPVIATLA